ncbi:MAG: hypothetical protein JO269_07455 [Burkholderiaceae bacterium]|nr:hypothetical protein [Burkholderiaceae bacterium]
MTSDTIPASKLMELDDADAKRDVTRDELYSLVWREPMLRVANRFGVSSSYMARVCTELSVPRPARGYWAKLEHGQKPHQPPLPPAEPGDVTEWCRGQTPVDMWPQPFKPILSRPPRPPQKRPRPDTKHPLVVDAKAHFVVGRKGDEGLLRPQKKLLVDIVVSEQLLDVALSASNTIFGTLEQRGHRVVIAPSGLHMQRAEVDLRVAPTKNQYYQTVWSPLRPTVAYVDGIAIGLTLVELTEEVSSVYSNGKYIPLRDLSPAQLRQYQGHRHWTADKTMVTGRLCLQAYCSLWGISWSKQWRESKPGQIASMANKIAKELEESVPTISQEIEVAEKRAKEQHQKWQEEMERYRLEQKRAAQLKATNDARTDLLAAITAWDQARRIHAYFDSVTQEASRLNESEQAHLLGRIDEARKLIGQVDALAVLKSWKTPGERL